jgi:uncharacterized membrane protein YesL
MATVGQEIAKVGSVFVKSLKDVKSAFGSVMMISGLSFITSTAFLWLNLIGASSPMKYFITLGLTVFIVPGSLAGTHFVMGRLSQGERVHLDDYFLGFRTYYFRSLGLVLLTIVVLFILYIDSLLFLNSTNFIIQLLGGLWLYGMLYILFISNYYFPLMIIEDLGIRAIVRRALGLASEYLMFTIVMTVLQIVVAVVSFLTGALLVLFFMGFICLLQNNALYELKKGVAKD